MRDCICNLNRGHATNQQIVAAWPDGYPIIAVKRNVVAYVTLRHLSCYSFNFLFRLNFRPPSSDVFNTYWTSATDGAKIMSNALLYTDPTCKAANMETCHNVNNICAHSHDIDAVDDDDDDRGDDDDRDDDARRRADAADRAAEHDDAATNVAVDDDVERLVDAAGWQLDRRNVFIGCAQLA